MLISRVEAVRTLAADLLALPASVVRKQAAEVEGLLQENPAHFHMRFALLAWLLID